MSVILIALKSSSSLMHFIQLSQILSLSRSQKSHSRHAVHTLCSKTHSEISGLFIIIQPTLNLRLRNEYKYSVYLITLYNYYIIYLFIINDFVKIYYHFFTTLYMYILCFLLISCILCEIIYFFIGNLSL